MDAMEDGSLAACMLDWNGDLLEVLSMSPLLYNSGLVRKKKQCIMLKLDYLRITSSQDRSRQHLH